MGCVLQIFLFGFVLFYNESPFLLLVAFLAGILVLWWGVHPAITLGSVCKQRGQVITVRNQHKLLNKEKYFMCNNQVKQRKTLQRR